MRGPPAFSSAIGSPAISSASSSSTLSSSEPSSLSCSSSSSTPYHLADTFCHHNDHDPPPLRMRLHVAGACCDQGTSTHAFCCRANVVTLSITSFGIGVQVACNRLMIRPESRLRKKKPPCALHVGLSANAPTLRGSIELSCSSCDCTYSP